MNPPPADDAIAHVILTLVADRAAGGASICPSEAARALAPAGAPDDWRPLMGPVRRVAAGLAREGRIDILRKGKPIDPEALRGVIRLRARRTEGGAA